MRPLDFDFLKDRYDSELERKDKLTASVAFPVAVLTALGGLIVAMGRSFSYRDSVLTVLFLAPVCLGFAAFAKCLYHLAYVYHGTTYEYLPRLGELEEAQKEWRDFYSYGHDEGADEDFASELRRRIIKSADGNAKNNERRTAFLDRANVALLAVLILTAVAGIPYVADQAREELMPTKQPTPKAAQTAQQSSGQKPQFPPNRVLKQGELPKR